MLGLWDEYFKISLNPEGEYVIMVASSVRVGWCLLVLALVMVYCGSG